MAEFYAVKKQWFSTDSGSQESQDVSLNKIEYLMRDELTVQHLIIT